MYETINGTECWVWQLNSYLGNVSVKMDSWTNYSVYQSWKITAASFVLGSAYCWWTIHLQGLMILSIASPVVEPLVLQWRRSARVRLCDWTKSWLRRDVLWAMR